MPHHCAVIGNPIAHSRSPEIHAGFATARGIALQYDRILAADEADFAAIVARFFADGGRGLNITVPYKQTAYRLCDRTTPYAAAAEAVNTLWVENGELHGDNTDGRGLVKALQEHGINLAGARILILGAGGAARGVILPLCEAKPAVLHLANRTLANAAAVIASQQPLTTVPLAAYSLDDPPPPPPPRPPPHPPPAPPPRHEHDDARTGHAAGTGTGTAGPHGAGDGLPAPRRVRARRREAARR